MDAILNGHDKGHEKKTPMKEWQKSVISTAITSLFTGAILCVIFYFNTKYELSDHDSKINALEAKTGQIESSISVMKTDIGRIQIQIEDVGVQLHDIKNDVTQIHQDVQKIYQILLENR